MKILGIGAPFFLHDPASALIIDGEVVAAVEEERFNRKKHAIGCLSVESTKFCLKKAGIKPSDVEVVAFPWSAKAYFMGMWPHFFDTLKDEPSRAFKGIKNFTKKKKEISTKLKMTLKGAGIDPDKVEIRYVEHHLAHASSAYHLSGFKDSAIMTMDGSGEFATTVFWEGVNGKIRKIKEFYLPNSLGRFYSTVTAYLGFQANDGEYKLMGMAPYGDPSKVDISKVISYDKAGYKTNPDYVWVTRSRRYDVNNIFSKHMVKMWGPPRTGDGLTEPYIHIAAATQKTLEDVTLGLIDTYLGDILKKNGGNLSFAGGCALNVSLNRKLLGHPLIKHLYVQPASSDAGTPLGAATYVASELGEKLKPMTHVYLGPSYTNDEIKKELDKIKVKYTYHEDIEEVTAQLLSQGQIVAWFQGEMEYGPRALGNRSILGNPTTKGVSDRINEIIKFRENWRPFCPSMLPEYAKEILDSDHPALHMTLSFKISDKWKSKIPEAVHVDGTIRPQVVDPKTNPKYYKLLSIFNKKTGIPVLINTSLNRRGEPMVCSPKDAINMFYGSGLENLVMGNYLLRK